MLTGVAGAFQEPHTDRVVWILCHMETLVTGDAFPYQKRPDSLLVSERRGGEMTTTPALRQTIAARAAGASWRPRSVVAITEKSELPLATVA